MNGTAVATTWPLACMLTIAAHTPWIVALSATALVWMDPAGTRLACETVVDHVHHFGATLSRDLLTNTTK